MKAVSAIQWAITILFSILAFLNLVSGDIGAVFFAVFALIALPLPQYRSFLKRHIPNPDIRLVIGIAAVAFSILVIPEVREAAATIQWDADKSAAYNIGSIVGYLIGTVVGNLVLIG